MMRVERYVLEISYDGEPQRRLMSESTLMANVQTAVMTANSDDEEFELVGISVKPVEEET